MIDRINKAIADTDVSVQKVAEACHISVQAVYKWQRGGVDYVEPEHLFAVADLTGFSARWLALGDGPERPEPTNRREQALLDHYRAGSEKDRRMIERVAEAAADYPVEADGSTAPSPVIRRQA